MLGKNLNTSLRIDVVTTISSNSLQQLLENPDIFVLYYFFSVLVLKIPSVNLWSGDYM